MKKYALLLSLQTVFISLSAQTSRTWTGSSSTDWNTAGNWSPSGVPSSADHIVLNTASGNQPMLDASHSITNITVSAGTLNLNGYTLTVTGTTSLTGGAINNGTASFNNSTTNIAGTAFGARVNISASSVYLAGSTYNKPITISKTGSSSDLSNGGNTFNDTLDIHLTNGSLTLYQGGNDVFNGNIIVSNTGSGAISFGSGNAYSGTLASGKTISIGSAGFTSGTLNLRRFTQSGSTAQSITLGGSTTTLSIGTNSVFNGALTVTVPQIDLYTSTFNKKVTITRNGTSSGTMNGGNTFNDTLDIHLQNNGSLTLYGGGNDAFNGDILVSNSGTGALSFGNANTAYSGTLASGKKLVVDSASFNKGSLNLRKFIQTGTTAQTIILGGTATSLAIGYNSVFNGVLTVNVPQIDLYISTFNKRLTLTRRGSTSGSMNGGNTFNDTLDIRLQNNGSLTLYQGGNDAFNGDVFISNTGTGTLSFGGSTSTYSGTLASGKKLVVDSANFNKGILNLRKFIQTGSTAQTIILGGTTTTLTIGYNSVFNGVLTVNVPRIDLLNSTFNKKLSLTRRDNSAAILNGGNTFNDTLDIRLQNNGSMTMHGYGSDVFNGNIIVSNTGTGSLSFGTGSYSGTLASGKTISIGSAGFNSGILNFRKFTQSGSTAQSITLGGSSTQLNITNTSVFNGNLTISAPNVTIQATTSGGTLNVTKSSSSTNIWTDANTYNGDVSITNTGTGYINLSSVASGGDTYNGNATFTKSGTGDIILAGSSSTVTFKGNVTLNNISSTQFTGSQVALFNGSSSQTLSQSGGSLNFGRLTINKSSNSLTLGSPLTVSTALTLTSGNIITTSTNLLNFADNATVSGASNSSYVQGPVSKTGNDAFTFPTGKASYYRPIGITAPASTATVFTTEYFNTGQILGSTVSSPLTRLSNCEYWNLTRSGTSSNATVTLNWGSGSCETANPAMMRVASWNGSQWVDAGNTSNTGSNTTGSVSSSSLASFSAFALGNSCSNTVSITTTPSDVSHVCPGVSVTLTSSSASGNSWNTSASTQSINPTTNGSYTVMYTDGNNCAITATQAVAFSTLTATISASPNPPINICESTTITLTSNTASSYLWSPGSETTQSITPEEDATYTLTTYDGLGCSATANIDVSINPLPTLPSVPSGTDNRCGGIGTDEYTITTDNYNTIIWTLTPHTAGTLIDAGVSTTITWNPDYSGTATLRATAQNTCGERYSEIVIDIQSPTIYYADFDGDGLGNPMISTTTCPQPNGYVPASAGFDCDDNTADVE